MQANRLMSARVLGPQHGGYRLARRRGRESSAVCGLFELTPSARCERPELDITKHSLNEVEFSFRECLRNQTGYAIL